MFKEKEISGQYTSWIHNSPLPLPPPPLSEKKDNIQIKSTMNAFPPFRLAVHRQWKRHWFTAVCSTWTSWLSLIAGTNFANYLSIPVYSCLVLKSTTTKNDPPKWRDFFFFFAQTRNESHPSLVPIRCCAIGACRVWTCPSHRFTTPTFFFCFFLLSRPIPLPHPLKR